MLKGLCHLLEYQGQRQGLSASITIKLPFKISRPLAFWASWRYIKRAVWWHSSSTNLPIDCFHYARQCTLFALHFYVILAMTCIACFGMWIPEGRGQNHYAKNLPFSDCFSREFPKERYKIVYCNLHNGNAVIWFKK